MSNNREHRGASAQTVASAPPYPSSNAPSYLPYYHRCTVPRKAAVLLKFSTKSQLSAFKGAHFSTWVACPPQAKQRDEVISQPVHNMCHGTWATALVSFSLLAPEDSCCFAVILAFITHVFLFLDDMAGSDTLQLAMPFHSAVKTGSSGLM